MAGAGQLKIGALGLVTWFERMEPRRRSRIALLVNLGPFLAFVFLLFLLPTMIVVFYSFGVWGTPAAPLPPTLGFDYYASLQNPPFPTVFARSFLFAAAATIVSLVVGYPVAYFIALRSGRYRNLLVLFVLIPFFVTFIIRAFALRQMFHQNSFLYPVLVAFGWESGAPFLQTWQAVVGGLVYNYIPFMVLPLYANMVGFDTSLLEAAQSLGAGRFRTFVKVTLPLTMGGVVAGSLLVFIPAAGELVIPALLGGPSENMLGYLIWQTFFQIRNWNIGSSLSLVVIAVTLVITFAYLRLAGRKAQVGLL